MTAKQYVILSGVVVGLGIMITTVYFSTGLFGTAAPTKNQVVNNTPVNQNVAKNDVWVLPDIPTKKYAPVTLPGNTTGNSATSNYTTTITPNPPATPWTSGPSDQLPAGQYLNSGTPWTSGPSQ